MNENIKTKALKFIFENIHSKGIYPQISFNEFRKANMYFISHLPIKEQMKEFEFFKFYENCRRLKLPVLKSEIKQFLIALEGTKNGKSI